MGQGLSHYARLYLGGKQTFLAALTVPVLLWESGHGSEAVDQSWRPTSPGQGPVRPRAGEPVVYELRKAPASKNPFAMGVTLGRVLHNDLVVDDISISRFHAWFQQDGRTGEWQVADAESTNGSKLDGTALPPNVRRALADRAKLRFGDVTMTFLEPRGLWDFIAAAH